MEGQTDWRKGKASITTGFEDYIFPPILDRSVIVTLLVDFTPGGMMRAVITCLLATGILPKASTIPPDWRQEGLSCTSFDIRNTDGTTDESNLAPTTAPVVTRKGKQRILHHPPTPQEWRQPPPTTPPGAMPPPTPVALPPRTRMRKQRGPARRNLCSPLKRPPGRQRQLFVRENTKAHTQLRYKGSHTCSTDRRNS